MPPTAQIFTFLFLMLGPFKIIANFSKITQNADRKLTLRIAFMAILFSSIALLLAAFIGEQILLNFGIPVPILALAGGLILFIVALQNIVRQYTPPESQEQTPITPTMKLAMNPLAFPTIVTPYGIAAVIVFISISPDVKSQIIIGAMVLGIMLINLIFMIINKYIFKFLAIVLPILGAILGVVQVALGLMIIYNSINKLLGVQ